MVPNSTAGMVIGKGGSYIQEIKDKTGAYVQISQKSREFNLFERCIIIAGDLDQTRAAVQLILTVIAADPQSASCPNLSYHDIRGPVASVYPTGSPYATPVLPCPATPSWMTAGGSPVDPASASAAAAMMAAMFSPGTMPTVGSAPGSRSSTFGFFSTNYSSSPDFTSLAVLASNQHALGLTPMLQPIALPSPGTATAAGDLVGAPGTPYGSSPTQPTGFASAGALDPGSVPESVIGLILGPQGRSIMDLQTSTGTVIQISQKGVYLTGTQNRLVTITGAQPNVQWAADVIEQRLQAERLRRESSSSNQPTPPPAAAATAGPITGSDAEVQRNVSLFYPQAVTAGLYGDPQLSGGSSMHIPVTSGSSTGLTAAAAAAVAAESTVVQPQSQQLTQALTTTLQPVKRESDTHGFRQPP
ncbi:unnamed protein product [Echinostoma caproni]|uniref:K Homology domain-containing protein n=1 Tax=Echinostoma caproni TaxID=27848 RepID=A0A3P8HZ24_9TREM|nr:unnamed protein product [Echinostoma caproni]